MICQPAPQIAVVSDVSLGYGSPQVHSLATSLAEQYGTTAVVLEPDQSGRPPLPFPPGPRLRVERIDTTVSPYTAAGRLEYVLKAAQRINALRPPMVVCFCTYTLPVLFKLDYQPAFTIYDCIESVAFYGENDVRLNRLAASRLNLVIFPEENRARLDGARCGLLKVPTVVFYNVQRATSAEPIEPERRNGALLYSGTLDRQQTLADYFLRPEIRSVRMDLFGNPGGPDGPALLEDLSRAGGGIRYCGFVPAERLAALRRHYAFSLVMWSPHSEQQYYAAPNKFFDAISDGVPPLTAPHPQCEMLVQRYGCGLVMADWSYNAFRDGVEEAVKLFNTPYYGEMVENCRRAVKAELQWDHQFAKVRRHLPDSL